MNYPPFKKLQTFVAIATSGNFRKASERLNLSPQAISTHIRDLEEQFQLPLFHRTTRSVRLTADGERLLIRARRVIEELEQALLEIEDHAALQRGVVVATCVPTLASQLLPRVVSSFMRRFPKIKIRIFDEIAGPLISRVREREADFGIGPQFESSEELAFELLFEDPFIAACSPNHPLAKSRRVTLHDLTSHDLLALAPHTNLRAIMEQAFQRQGLPLKPAHEAQHRLTLCGMAEAGLGVALLPKTVMSMINTNLVIKPISGANMVCEYGIITRRDHAQSPAVSAFLTSLKKSIATQ